jgi:formate C-acetyltransferase
LLQPFYEADIEAGRIDRETAVYYLACFLINDPIYWQLGGPDAEGKDMTSEISYLILEAGDKINTSLNLTVRVHDGMDDGLMRKAVECLIRNRNGWPRFSGDQALVEGFMKNGFDAAMARRRIAVGCNWMSLPGLEYTMNDLVKVNMAKVFEVAFDEVASFSGVEELWDKFAMHLGRAVHTAAEGIRHHLKYQKYNEPELLLNLLSHGPIEKGLDASDGGAKYYNLAIDGAGLAVVADSFAAIQEHVQQKQDVSWEQLKQAVGSDFRGEENEKVRLLLKKTGRYGKENSTGERWALRIRDEFAALVKAESEPQLCRCFIPGFFSWANTVGFGAAVGATPDGRYAGTPISHGANPVPGFVKDGASLSLAKAIAKIQPGYGNTAPMQWELDPGFAKEDNVSVVEAILKAHFKMGGTLVNVNIMDKDVILKAHKDPSLYPDLVVRVTGFTAYFCMLSPEFRQLVVDRILMY